MTITLRKNTSQFLLLALLTFGISIQTLQAGEDYVQESQRIFDVIDRWAEAWINLDAETYISFYSKDYRPDDKTSHQAWVIDRKHRLNNQQWLKLGISGIVISKHDDNTYSVMFKQRYKSDSFRDNVRKELVFIKADSQWRINAERVLGQ